MKYKQKQYQNFFWDFSKKRAKNFVPKILSTKVPMYVLNQDEKLMSYL